MFAISFNNSELYEYIYKLSNKYDGKPIFQEAPEEYAEDIQTASENLGSYIYKGIVKIAHNEISSSSLRFKYFVDGVVETRPIRKLNIKGIWVPLHLVTCGAGVFERTEKMEIKPTNNVVFLQFLAFPYTALKELDDTIEMPPGINLNRLKPLMDNLQRGVSGNLWLDTSISFGSEKRTIEKMDLLKTGQIRAKARDQARIIMRLLEVGVLHMLKKLGYNGLIAFDGPISPFYIYANIVSNELKGLYELSDKGISYNMLKDVIGCIKRIYKVPSDDSMYTVLSRQTSDEQTFIIYRMSEVVKPLREDRDETYLEDVIRATLSAFTVLRPEVSKIYEEKIASNISMITRFDIPLPNICDQNEDWYIGDFVERAFKEIFPNELINSSNNRGKKLYEIFKAITAEKYPIPSAHGSRLYTELYPIYETEFWLKSYIKAMYFSPL
jgi:hypothetical protein